MFYHKNDWNEASYTNVEKLIQILSELSLRQNTNFSALTKLVEMNKRVSVFNPKSDFSHELTS